MAKLSVAFQGEKGAFSEQAARGMLGRSVTAVPLKTFDDVFEKVQSRKVGLGIIPIENSLFGSIHQNYDLLRKHNVHIVGEVKLRIVHALLALSGVTIRKVRFVYSHPQALGQCSRFLRSLSNAEPVPVYDTAGAAKLIKEEHRLDSAAIASVEAARVYKMRILKKGIEDDHQNFTRFLLISARASTSTGLQSKTSIIFTLPNIPGALFRALSVFALRDVDLFKIESRPLVGKPWEYLFYLDFRGGLGDLVCQRAMSHLQEITSYVKILGSYPQGRTLGRIRQ